MPITTIGDMSQHFQSVRNTGLIKSRLSELSQELSTGQVSDIGKHLMGDTSDLIGLNHEISLLEIYGSTNDETARTLEAMQLNLQRVDATRANAAASLLTVNADSNRSETMNAAVTGKNAFADTVGAFNASSSGRRIFSGTLVDQAPLLDHEAMLSEIVTAVGGASEKESIVAAIDSWFDTVGGGFETVGYLGGHVHQSRKLDAESSTEIDVRADDTGVKDLLKGLAYAAVASEMSSSLTDRTFGELVNESGVKLIGAAVGLSDLQGRLGQKEEAVAVASSSNSAQLSSYQIARSDLIKADPFETATRLQEIQTQLETHFAVTARLSNLNLVDFLR